MLRLAAALALFAITTQAAVTRIEITERSQVLDGKSFGNAGPYERLAGKVYFTADPKLPANRAVADIDLAPVNAAGHVEYSADLYMLSPAHAAKSNHTVLLEISNRGGKGMLATFNRATGSPDPRTAAQFGDGFLMEQGYTLVWVGWQFDVPRREGLLRLYTPIATDHGKTITGLVRAEFVPDVKTAEMPLADRGHAAYQPVSPDDPKLELTERDTVTGPRRTIPRGEWKMQTDAIYRAAGFTPGKIYEFVYLAKDPPVAGLGMAAVRDLVSYARSEWSIQRAYAFGVSQSGRFLRTFVHDGFNADESGRQVFDGILAHVSGAGLGSFNVRFAQPSRDGHPFLNPLYPTDVFPYTDSDQTDPYTGATSGLLDLAKKTHTTPKIFYSDSSYEYWGRSAALLHSSMDGKKDVPLEPTTRMYFFAGGQHGPAPFPPPQHETQNLSSPVPYTWSLRALLVAMDGWVKDGAEPPASRYPKVSQDNLVTPGAIQFPKIPGVAFPKIAHRAYELDFRSEPPKVIATLPILLPQVDRDGNDLGGIRLPEVATPLATYTGWNLRSAKIGAPDELYSMQGSFLPFARTQAEREAKGDPRLSIAERYAGRDEYLAKVTAAAKELVKSGYLLERDVPKLVEHSAREWDWIAAH